MGFNSKPATQSASGEVFVPLNKSVSLSDSSSNDSNLVRTISVPVTDPSWVDTTVQSVANTLYQAKDKLDSASEMLNHAKDKLTSTYDQVAHNVNDSREKAMSYGRENPGTTGLILFGTGVGVGALLVTLLRKRH